MAATTTTSPLDFAALALAQIDHERVVLRDTLARTSNHEITEPATTRSQELRRARAVVAARVAASAREQMTGASKPRTRPSARWSRTCVGRCSRTTRDLSKGVYRAELMW